MRFVPIRMKRDWINNGRIYRGGRIYSDYPRGAARLLERRGIAEIVKANADVQPETHSGTDDRASVAHGLEKRTASGLKRRRRRANESD